MHVIFDSPIFLDTTKTRIYPWIQSTQQSYQEPQDHP